MMKHITTVILQMKRGYPITDCPELPYFAYHNEVPSIHRQDREGMHYSPQLDDNEVSNNAEPAARPCGEC